MRIVRNVMVGLAILQLVIAGFIALTASFADGGTIWERILLSLIHPVTAIVFLIMVLKAKALALTKQLKYVAITLLLVNIAGDISASALIRLGVINGDWFLPLIFSVIPVIGIVYGLTSATKQA